MACDRCAESVSRGYGFCAWCGERIVAGTVPQAPPQKKEKGHSVALFQAGLCIMIICSAVLMFEVITAFWFSWDILMELSGYSAAIFIITPIPTRLFSVSGGVLQAYYIFLLAAMALSVAYLFYKALRPIAGFVKDKDAEPVKNTALFEMTVLFAALYAVELALMLAFNAAGVGTDSPFGDETIIELMYELLNASVWEEVISRMLLIGVPMLFAALLLNEKGTRWWKYLTGGFGMSPRALFLIFFSAAMFGLAHVPGWEWWKFFSTFLFGLIAGYLFVKYGVYATISIHFLTNYLMSSDWMFGDDGTVIGLIMFGVLLLGIPYVWVYTKRGVNHLRGVFRGE